MENNETGKKMDKKKLALVVAVAVIALGGVGYKVYADTQYKEKVAQALSATTKTDNELTFLEKELAGFYESDDQEFLAKEVTTEDLSSWKAKLDKLILPKYEVSSKELTTKISSVAKEKEAIEGDFAVVSEKLTQQELLNAMFQKDKAINGSIVKGDLVIIDDLKNEQLITFPEDEKGTWAEAVKKVLKNASDQLAQIKKSSEQVDKLFKDNKVIAKIDDKVLKSVQDEVKKIRNEKARKAQEARIKQVTDEISKRKKAEEKVKAEEAAKAVGGTVVVDNSGNVKVVSASGEELTQTGDGSSSTWVADTSSQGNASNGWTAPADSNNNSSGNQTQPPATQPPVAPPTVTPPVTEPPVTQPPANTHGSQCEVGGLYPTYAAAEAAGFAAGANRVRVSTVYCEHNIVVGYSYTITG